MSPAAELTVTVVITRRSRLSRLRRIPKLFLDHYRGLRRHGNGPAISAYAAWLLCRLVATFRPTPPPLR